MATVCSNCGAVLTYPVVLDGKIFGKDCAAYVLGIHPSQLRYGSSGDVDRAAIAQDRESQAARRAADEAAVAAARVQRDAACVENRARYAEVIEVLQADGGEFTAGMARIVEEEGLPALSPRQYAIVADIFGKSFGRGGSKKYWAARDRLNEMSDVVTA